MADEWCAGVVCFDASREIGGEGLWRRQSDSMEVGTQKAAAYRLIDELDGYQLLAYMQRNGR